MITSYILILCLSAGLASYLLLHLAWRLVRLLKLSRLKAPAGVIALMATLAFLVVTAAPASVLMACLLLLAGQFLERRYYLPMALHWGIPLAAAFLTSSSLSMPAFAGLSGIALHTAAAIALMAMVLTPTRLSDDFASSSRCLLFPLLPLLAAPFFSAPSFIALDIALLASSLLGAAMVGQPSSTMGLARAPFALLIGWLMLEAATHGAWIVATVSLFTYASLLVLTLTHKAGRDAYAL